MKEPKILVVLAAPDAAVSLPVAAWVGVPDAGDDLSSALDVGIVVVSSTTGFSLLTFDMLRGLDSKLGIDNETR